MRRIISVSDVLLLVIFFGVLLAAATPHIIDEKPEAESERATANIDYRFSELNVYYNARERLSKLESLKDAIPPVMVGWQVCLGFQKIDGSLLYVSIDDTDACKNVWRNSKFRYLKERIIENNNILDISPRALARY